MSYMEYQRQSFSWDNARKPTTEISPRHRKVFLKPYHAHTDTHTRYLPIAMSIRHVNSFLIAQMILCQRSSMQLIQ